jgi:hypothetical protein
MKSYNSYKYCVKISTLWIMGYSNLFKRVSLAAIILFTTLGCQSQNSGTSTTEKTNDSPISPNASDLVGKAAKLSPKQVDELISLANRKAYKGLGSKEEVKAKFVVPTYLPPGFVVTELRTNYSNNLGGRYEITYCNSNKSCFLLDGGIPLPMGDEPTSYETTKEITSPALGKIILGFTESRKSSNKVYIGFKGEADQFWKDDNSYRFDSPVPNGENSESTSSISFQEAAKIVESLQYINP